VSGIEYSAENLANKLLHDASYLKNNGGGYTFSGGEPLAQGEFLIELLERLKSSHRVIETSGYCSRELFSEVLKNVDLILMDIKIIESEKHIFYTGVDNVIILENLELLKSSGKPHIIRVPVIPGVNDDETHYNAIADLLQDDKSLMKVEMLPYHKTAGAKYVMLNMEYKPEFDTEKIPNLDMSVFLSKDIPCTVI